MKKQDLGASRYVRRAAVFAVAGTLCFGALIAAGNGSSNTSSPSSKKADAPLPRVADVAPMLALDHRSLAAAGLSAASVTAIDAALSSKITHDWGAMKTLLQQRDAAVSRVGVAPSDSRSNRPRSSAGRLQESAQAQLSVSNWLANCRQAMLAGVPAEQLAKLDSLYANRDSGLPLEFRIRSYTQAELVKLRESLSQRARAQQLGESLDSQTAAWIAQQETTDVIAARNRIAAVPADSN